MEILIVGSLLVALMVYVSTKIKKAAALAYEPEHVEKPDFRIEKPAGFMYPLNAETEFPFEAYSKQYGDRGTRNIWRARIRLRTSEGLNIRKIIRELEEAGESNVSEKVLGDLPGGQIGSIVRTIVEDDEVEYRILRKIVADKGAGRTYELKTTILSPYVDEYNDKICEMMKSFELKTLVQHD